MKPTEVMLKYTDSNLPPFSHSNLSALFVNVFHIICREKLLVGSGKKNLQHCLLFLKEIVRNRGNDRTTVKGERTKVTNANFSLNLTGECW